MRRRVFIITGAMAAGKSTVAKALAVRLQRSAHVGGDAFLDMIVNGRAVMGPTLDAEARRQLTLRQVIAADVVRHYHAADFDVVYQDILVGDDLADMVARLAELDPTVVVLAPTAATLAKRDAERPKTGYAADFPPTVLDDALRLHTPRIGTWIDSSEMSVDEVVATILAINHPQEQ